MQARASRRTARTQAERSAATTERLHASARRLFATKGYAATSLAEIVADAGLTKGAIYHHFVNKEEVFREVFEREQRALVQVVSEAARGETDPWKAFTAGWQAFVEASQEPSVRRITLVEAPIALGWERVRLIGSSYTLALVESGLSRAMDAGRVARRPVRPLARLVFAAMCEGSLIIAGAADQQSARRQVADSVGALLSGLEPRPPGS